MRKILIAALCALVMGCTSARISRSLASGAIGCPVKDIKISNETVSSGVHNFTATCDGVDYFCTYMYPNPTSCKERKKINENQHQGGTVH